MTTESYVLIIGGGLAGLTSAIHLAKEGVSVILIEKDSYPKHKVCGEYISNEVLPYFNYLDINPEKIGAVAISKFVITTQSGNTIKSKLPLGGFGISRYSLDHFLWQKAAALGVVLINDQVLDVQYKNDLFQVSTQNKGQFTTKYVIGAYGKRSILDKTLNRGFSTKKSPWLAVKGHYNADFDVDTVALHNFEGGYCGLSKVENNRVNACYLVNYESFQRYKDIQVFQDAVMKKNKHLNTFFNEAQPIFDKPITISQINFDKKKPVENHVFMTGDAAGLIHPLCGNGMAMAIQGGQIISKLLIDTYTNKLRVPRTTIEEMYLKEWNTAFSKRLYAGRVLQKVLLNSSLQKMSYTIANMVPGIVPKIIKQTHGEPLVVC
ncbi:NAD(P)/FAD-dependent oxidoreductase [Aquimarina sp. AD10]|uniref:NAD(P)/FAD-dependent oxidoreductase n=1 Tax=Aquimarina sp. AD10 TaxID=1714849 RepID=UPI000E5055C7|nr:NAD(P)/FAD-dependent oxidoreductase [Aquimarina sp. AD10]AXT59502.1 NAD(P)/FAD-dependent oxidoreductase [Aquimarina sp. AD10]RKN00403.1 FAD-dependent oxidoreductase [Aquimarina sp. AD10]